MNDIAIKIENLTKEYKISHEVKEPYKKLSDTMVAFSKKLIKPWKLIKKTETEVFKALDDINLEIKKGDKVGIIGRNGAGKSTLLKILSRITEPTKGRVKINGRVASLLEVGTGFHPELTGRENIYLNGSILGMTQKEIEKKFDEIVEFSGCERFLDTPIKRYSSGMKVRLGFAVAAHLESEILIVDEVLAVGDAEFQKKCIGKMDELTREKKKTIIFVSHDISAVKTLCDKTILLENGLLKLFSFTDEVIDIYYEELKNNEIYTLKEIEFVKFLGVDLKANLYNGEKLELNTKYISKKEVQSCYFDFVILNRNNLKLFHYSSVRATKYFDLNEGETHIKITIKDLTLNEGDYYITAFLSQTTGNVLHYAEKVSRFKVVNSTKVTNLESILSLDPIVNIETKEGD